MLRRVVTLVCALGLGMGAVLGFATGNLWHAYRNGAPGTYWVLGAGTIALVASVVFCLRAKRAHPGWFASCIALPQIASLASSLWTGRKLDGALVEMVGDVVPRIVAEGTAELTLPVALADLFTAAIAATIAIGLTERGRAIAKRTLAVGGLWIALSIVLFVLSVRGHEVALRPLVPIVVVAMVAAAVMSGDDDWTPLVGLAGLIAVCLLERAIAERERSNLLGAISMENVAVFDQARWLASYLDVRAHARLAMGVHVVLGAATFLSARGFPKNMSIPAVSLVALAFVMSAVEHRAFVRRMSAARNAFDVGVPIPTTNAKSGWSVYGDRLVITRDGTLREVVIPGQEEEEQPVDPNEVTGPRSRERSSKPVFADEELTCEKLAAALHPKEKRRQSFALAALYTRPKTSRPSAGDLEPLVGERELVGLGFDFGQHYPMIEAIVRGDTFVLQMGGPDLTFALGVDPEEVARTVTARFTQPLPRRETIRLTVHASDTVRRLAAALSVLTVAFPMEGTYQHRYFALRVE